MEFPVVEKSEENLPMLFFQHLVTIRQNSNSLLFTKRLSATIIIFNPVEYLPNLWHGAPTYVLTPQGKWHIYVLLYEEPPNLNLQVVTFTGRRSQYEKDVQSDFSLLTRSNAA